MIAKDLSKQPALDADLEVIQQVSFVQNLSGNINRLMFFIIEEAKETIHKEPKVLWMCSTVLFCSNIISI